MTRNSRPGFTLLELMIVLLVLGILAAVAAPRYQDSLQHFRVEATARRIVADLERARGSARAAGADRRVRFEPAAERYTLDGICDPDHPTAGYTVDLARTGYPATLETASFDGTAQLTFDLYGQPWAGIPPAPLSSGAVIVRAGRQYRTVVVDPVSGRARKL